MIQYYQQLNNASQLFITTSILETKLLVTNLVFIYKLINSFKHFLAKIFCLTKRPYTIRRYVVTPVGKD